MITIICIIIIIIGNDQKIHTIQIMINKCL